MKGIVWATTEHPHALMVAMEVEDGCLEEYEYTG